MKKYKYLYLLLGIFAFALQMYDITSASLSLNITATFGLVVIQMFGLSLFAYYQKDHVKDPKKFIDMIHVVVFLIYLINLMYELFFNPELRHLATTAYTINLVPFKTIRLYVDAYQAGTLPISTIFLNLAGNILLFMPFGYFIYILFKPCRNFLIYMLVMLVIIAGVEICQTYFYVGTGDIDDLILNMIGVLIFYLLTFLPPLCKYLQSMKVVS